VNTDIDDDNGICLTPIFQNNPEILDFRMIEVVVITGAIILAKLQSNRHHQ